MRVVLCHHCWTWEFFQGAACPDCHHLLSLDDPDPTAEELSQRLGTVVMRLGEVAWERDKLPTHGEVWGTTTGLIYWPLLSLLPNGSIVPTERVRVQEMSWSLMSLWKSRSSQIQTTQDEQQHVSFPADREEMGQSFLNTPGAAFFSRENLVKVQCRGRNWMLFRTPGRSVRMKCVSSPAEWKPAWHAFLQQDTWRQLSRRIS